MLLAFAIFPGAAASMPPPPTTASHLSLSKYPRSLRRNGWCVAALRRDACVEGQRQDEEAERDSRRTKQDRYAEMRRKKDEEREAQDGLMEEEARARKTKEEAAAALEFGKWKGAFSVDAEGTTESQTQDDGQGLLHNFVEYIKDCINRIITKAWINKTS